MRAPEHVAAERDPQADLGKAGEVAAVEGVEVVGAVFGATVASPEIVLEKDGHLLEHRRTVVVARGGYLQRRDEVLFAVGAHFADRKLAAGDHHAEPAAQPGAARSVSDRRIPAEEGYLKQSIKKEPALCRFFFYNILFNRKYYYK